MDTKDIEEVLLELLRDALNNLYNLERLRDHRLIALLALERKSNPPSELQKILTDAIASLEPDPDVPSHCRAWRIYDLLFCRYVQQLSAKVVSDQLGISSRHLRREQRSALEALAYRLRETYTFSEDGWTETEDTEAEDTFQPPAQDDSPSIQDELAWLKDAVMEKPTALNDTLDTVVKLVRPLLENHQANLKLTISERLPALAIHPVALNQLLLNLLSVTISWAAGSDVNVEVTALDWQVNVQIQGMTAAKNEHSLSKDDRASLKMAQQLAEVSGCHLTSAIQARTLTTTLILPAFERLPILVIDDNADTLQLLKHYTTGTRYHFIGTQDPKDALTVAETHPPQVIALDVMMPQVDGWQVLGQLRQHPATAETPIIVCTILAQEELALSLGASDFLRKPVSQHDFLSALDQQIAIQAPKVR
jgi:CheY-like chemotaxis protein